MRRTCTVLFVETREFASQTIRMKVYDASVMTALQENLVVSEEPILQFALWRDFK